MAPLSWDCRGTCSFMRRNFPQFEDFLNKSYETFILIGKIICLNLKVKGGSVGFKRLSLLSSSSKFGTMLVHFFSACCVTHVKPFVMMASSKCLKRWSHQFRSFFFSLFFPTLLPAYYTCNIIRVGHRLWPLNLCCNIQKEVGKRASPCEQTFLLFKKINDVNQSCLWSLLNYLRRALYYAFVCSHWMNPVSESSLSLSQDHTSLTSSICSTTILMFMLWRTSVQVFGFVPNVPKLENFGRS